MSLVFVNLVKTNQSAFAAKVNAIARELSIEPNWLMAVMYSESRLNHTAVNSLSNATGLIQFMPDTARGLGTSVSALRNMSNIQQLDYVRKYFLPFKGRMHSVYDVYLITFFPVALGKPDDWVFQTKNLSASTVAKYNPGIAQGKKQITVRDFKNWFYKNMPENSRDYIFKASIGIGAIIFTVASIYLISKYK